MVRKDFLIQRFNEETNGKCHSAGIRVLNNELVTYVNVINEENLICIDGTVISENLFSKYNTKIELNAKNISILSTYCTCSDYEKNEFKKNNYCCKHLVATFHSSLDRLANDSILNKYENYIEESNIFKKSENKILSLLLNDEEDKEEIKFEIYINRHEWNGKITAEFKIGLKSKTSSTLYVLKDIEQFLVGYHNNIPIKYSKNFSFSRKHYKITTKDKILIDYIEFIKSLDSTYKSINRTLEKSINGKYITIPKELIRDFFSKIRKHRVYLNDGFFYKPVETEILIDEPSIEFDLKLIKDEYVLKTNSGMPQSLNTKGDVLLYGTNIYLPSYDYCYKIEPYLKIFSQCKVITIPKVEEEEILRKLIPNLNKLSNEVILSKNIKDKVVIEKVKFNFYFQKDNKDIILITKVKYGSYEFNICYDFNDKIIYRDVKSETRVFSLLRTLGFEEYQGKFYLNMGDDYVFRFFKTEINSLQETGQVYYSEDFKGIKYIGAKGIKGNIRAGKYNYFEFDFKIEGIPQAETTNILRAFRDNLKYYKLKDGEYIDLEELELKKFLKLLDIISVGDEINDKYIRINKNKSLYIDNYINENNLKYLKGKKHIKEIADRIKSINKKTFESPKELKANLRHYQVIGYNWLKTLEYLDFGGILADEMGLGKTLQAITFILSNNHKKTLIVAPTSLIYNWSNEFEKFAPTVKVSVVNGSKEEREEILNNINQVDVIITTYNLLKRDLEVYKEIVFHCCILDEAQNIKNPNSQNAIAVKEIKSQSRFALTGTPIENSLMELWSIFDFIMPGYLYDEKRFSVRYHKKCKEDPVVIDELNKLITPFILRRRKKDVIKELPNKIEKKFIVTLDKEQKKAYGIYAKHVMELIEKKVKNDEFKNSKIEILAYITKLRQLCLDPSVVINDYVGRSGKIDALLDIINHSIEGGHKVLVFSQFTSILKNISKRFEDENIPHSYLDGSILAQKRVDLVKDFNEGSNSVFLISLKSGGTGLNLTSADVVIHFDPWWNPAVEEQATDRAHRIGQKNVVEVIKLIAKGTIEEKVLALQDEKKALISNLMNDDLSKDKTLISLTEEDILALFQVN